jgi:polyisoprenoid-binding protein YceI
MRNFIAIIFLSIGLLAFSESIWKSDPNSVTVSFLFEKNNVSGTVEGFEGVIQFNSLDPAQSVVHGKVSVNSLKTGIFLRNMHLKTGSYFGEKSFPEMTFEGNQIKKTSNGYRVNGILTIRDIQKFISWKFERKSDGSMWAFTEIYTSDFGIKINKSREDNLVKITLKAPQKNI